MAQDDGRPPYVVFERRAVEDRNASIEAGRYVATDVDFALITRPGSRDTLEKNASEWIEDLNRQVSAGRVPQTWLDFFSSKYEAWKKGETLPSHGTPIKGWQLLSPSMQESIIQAGFLTVEDLAVAGESEVSRIGTGAITYRSKAQAWLAAAENQGKLAEKTTALETKVADLTALLTQLVEENKLLKAGSTIAKAVQK